MITGGNVKSTVYVLHVVEAQRRSPARVLQWLSGKSLVMAMDEAKTGKSHYARLYLPLLINEPRTTNISSFLLISFSSVFA